MANGLCPFMSTKDDRVFCMEICSFHRGAGLDPCLIVRAHSAQEYFYDQLAELTGELVEVKTIVQQIQKDRS